MHDKYDKGDIIYRLAPSLWSDGGREKRDRQTDTEDKNRAVSEDEGGLVQKMSTVLNNGVQCCEHGPWDRTPGRFPSARRPRPAARERRGREDGHRAFLSQPHPAGAASRPGLPMSLYTPGSSLFAETHAGKFTTAQALTGALGNAAVTMRDSPRPQTLGLFLKLWLSLCLINELFSSLCIGCLVRFDSLIQ